MLNLVKKYVYFMYYNDSFALSWCKTLFFTIVHNDTSIVGLLKLIDKVEFYYEHGSTDHPCLVGIFLKMFVKCQGYLRKVTMVIYLWIKILSLYFYVYIFFKILDQEKICRYKFLVFFSVLGWLAPTPNTPP